jgi:hypothetical protein
MFKDRKLVIATMHKKEQVLAPILENGLGVKCILPEHFNSDEWGTFSGEIERKQDPIETARQKCLKAMELSGCDLGIASEGSFGPHPSIFFVQADDEFLLLIDSKNKLEIISRELSTNTNFNSKAIQRLKGIEQAGYHSSFFPGSAYSRFEHSMGVYLLLKKYKSHLLFALLC